MEVIHLPALANLSYYWLATIIAGYNHKCYPYFGRKIKVKIVGINVVVFTGTCIVPSYDGS